MKAILEFNLPEESHEHLTAVHAGALSSALWSLDQMLRQKIKYAPENISLLELETWQKCRDMLTLVAEEHGVMEIVEL